MWLYSMFIFTALDVGQLKHEIIAWSQQLCAKVDLLTHNMATSFRRDLNFSLLNCKRLNVGYSYELKFELQFLTL
jgi:hypothetical protein